MVLYGSNRRTPPLKHALSMGLNQLGSVGFSRPPLPWCGTKGGLTNPWLQPIYSPEISQAAPATRSLAKYGINHKLRKQFAVAKKVNY